MSGHENSEVEPKFRLFSELRQRDVDQFDRLTPAALYGSMQDAAIAHSASKELSGEAFMQLGVRMDAGSDSY